MIPAFARRIKKTACLALLGAFGLAACTTAGPNASGALNPDVPASTAESEITTGSIRSARRVSGHLSAYGPAIAPEGFSGVCRRYPWACATGSQAPDVSEEALRSLAMKVNQAVNASVRPTTDMSLYRQVEFWTVPESGAGDCEDYALMKEKRLIEAGVPPDRLFLATALNRGGEHHVVLVVRAEGEDLVMDNLAQAVKPWEATGYTFLKIQSARDKHAWQAVLLGPRASRLNADVRAARPPSPPKL